MSKWKWPWAMRLRTLRHGASACAMVKSTWASGQAGEIHRVAQRSLTMESRALCLAPLPGGMRWRGTTSQPLTTAWVAPGMRVAASKET